MSDQLQINTASPDAKQEVENSKDGSKHIEPPTKRPRFDKSKSNRHGGVAYAKHQPVTSLQIVPRSKHFPIFVSNLGCRSLANFVYAAIRGRDFRLTANITDIQLAYVMAIAYCNRVVQVSQTYGYSFPLEASRLKQVATGIQLPNVLAQYIESIGAVELSSGVSIIPFAGNYRTLFPLNFPLQLDPATLLEEAERPIPDGEWALDTEWIVLYNDATTRASRSGIKFRSVDNTDYRGRSEMAVSWIHDQLNQVQVLPLAPQVLSEAEAQLGAAYNFRRYDQIEHWLGENKELLFNSCVGIAFDPQVAISDVCVAAFRGAVLSTD